MSEPRVRCTAAWRTAVLPLLVACLAPVAAAQSTEDYRERVQRLEQRYEILSVEEQRRLEALPQVELDTTNVGSIRIVAPVPAQAFITQVAGQLSDSLRTTLSRDTVLLPPVTFLLWPRGASSRRLERVVELQGVQLRFYQERDTRFRRADTPAGVASGLLHSVRYRTRSTLDSTLNQWIENNLVFDTLTAIQAQMVYLEVATNRWSIVRACYGGRFERCRDALALGPQGTTAWYTADERRQLVETAQEWEPRVQADPKAQRCVIGGDDHACVVVLDAYPHVVDEPLSSIARQSFLRTALQQGGTGSYGRLVQSDTLPLLRRLAFTAGLPVDSLIARWHDAIMAARPTGTVLSRMGGWTAFVWVVVLGLAAMRSTRWRVR